MEELIASTKIALANTFFMYYKAHSFHWNVEGIHFSQYHEFFGDLYEELYGAVDPLAEEIRALDSKAPRSIEDLGKYKTVVESNQDLTKIKDMLSSLQKDNDETLESLNKVFSLASKQNKQGLANFIADRIDKHNKHAWMIRVSLKGIEG